MTKREGRRGVANGKCKVNDFLRGPGLRHYENLGKLVPIIVIEKLGFSNVI